jgi:hypothetical protein
MFHKLAVAIGSVAAAMLLGVASADEKKVQEIKGWGAVVDPDGDCRVKAEDGKLTITVPKTYHDLTYADEVTKLNAPRALRDVEGDFRLEVTVKAFPLPEKDTSSSGRYSFVSSGLLVWEDDKNFIRMDRAAEGANGQPFIWVERFQDGKQVFHEFKQIDDKDSTLRVERKGTQLTFSVKEGDAQDWTEVHSAEAELPRKLKAGVLAINTTTREFSPQLEGLKLTAK